MISMDCSELFKKNIIRVAFADSPVTEKMMREPDAGEYRVSLGEQLRTFACDLSEVLPDSLVLTDGSRDDADILIVPDEDMIPPQGFLTEYSSGRLIIRASGQDGIFYGCVFVTESLRRGTVPDAVNMSPAVEERALFIDVGRKYYTPDFLKDTIVRISRMGMNALVLHFSEEMGLGIESREFPWLEGRDGTLCVPKEIDTDNRILTLDQLDDIIKTAKLRHVDVIPSFDSPGHMNRAVKLFNSRAAKEEFSFRCGDRTVTVPKGTDIANRYHTGDKTATVQGSRNTEWSRGIDLSQKTARDFAEALLRDFGEYFASRGCRSIDIGGDELLGWGTSPEPSKPKWMQLEHWKAAAMEMTGLPSAEAYDLFILYMNEMRSVAESMGYTSVRMWNDDAFRISDTGWEPDPVRHVLPDKDLEILFWTPNVNGGRNTVRAYIGQKKVYNYLNYYGYFVVGGHVYPGCDPDIIRREWTPFRFSGTADGDIITSDAELRKIGGCGFCIWGDDPSALTEEQVMEQVMPRLRAYAANAWTGKTNKKR